MLVSIFFSLAGFGKFSRWSELSSDEESFMILFLLAGEIIDGCTIFGVEARMNESSLSIIQSI